MQATVDSVGRVLIPKAMRDRLGISAGAKVDISYYGAGITIVTGERTARLIEEAGRLVADSDTEVDDDMVFQLLDEGRR